MTTHEKIAGITMAGIVVIITTLFFVKSVLQKHPRSTESEIDI